MGQVGERLRPVCLMCNRAASAPVRLVVFICQHSSHPPGKKELPLFALLTYLHYLPSSFTYLLDLLYSLVSLTCLVALPALTLHSASS